MLAHVYHTQGFIQDPAFNGFAAYLLPQSANKICIYSKSGFYSRIYMYGWYTHTVPAQTHIKAHTHIAYKYTCTKTYCTCEHIHTSMCKFKHTSMYASLTCVPLKNCFVKVWNLSWPAVSLQIETSKYNYIYMYTQRFWISGDIAKLTILHVYIHVCIRTCDVSKHGPFLTGEENPTQCGNEAEVPLYASAVELCGFHLFTCSQYHWPRATKFILAGIYEVLVTHTLNGLFWQLHVFPLWLSNNN